MARLATFVLSANRPSSMSAWASAASTRARSWLSSGGAIWTAVRNAERAASTSPAAQR